MWEDMGVSMTTPNFPLGALIINVSCDPAVVVADDAVPLLLYLGLFRVVGGCIKCDNCVGEEELLYSLMYTSLYNRRSTESPPPSPIKFVIVSTGDNCDPNADVA